MANENKMNIIEALVRLRNDLKLWVANNLRVKLDKNLGTDNSGKFLSIDATGEVIASTFAEIITESDSLTVVDEDGNKAFEIDTQGTTHVKAITVDGVDVLGDISTALDSILTQTATIIGGNS